MRNAPLVALMMLSAATLLGCPKPQDPEASLSLVQQTPAPLTLEAEIFDDMENPPTVTMSTGVAMAVTCWDSCKIGKQRINGCEGLVLEASDPDMLEVQRAFRSGYAGDTMVLIAKQPGRTTLNLRTRCGVKSFATTIE